MLSNCKLPKKDYNFINNFKEMKTEELFGHASFGSLKKSRPRFGPGAVEMAPVLWAMIGTRDRWVQNTVNISGGAKD